MNEQIIAIDPYEPPASAYEPGGPLYMSPEEAAHWEAYHLELEQDDRRARERRGKARPMSWGDPMTAEGYFCGPCWDRGDETGFHPHSDPPCDPIGRGDF
jgi:hypothetical protein